MNAIRPVHVARNVALAAAGWPGVSSITPAHIRGIRNMAIATHNTCAACGESLVGEGDARVELCHIVSAKSGHGITEFNAYVGHKACNDYDREVCEGDPFEIVKRMVRRDLVITEVPSRKVALPYADDTRAARVRSLRDNAPAWV